MTNRLMGYIMAGLLFLGIGQMWAGNVEQAAREAEEAADAAWAVAEPLGNAVRASRARTLLVSDSLQTEADSAVARGARAAQRASAAVAESHEITAAIDTTRLAVRGSLVPEQLPAFDLLMDNFAARQEQMEIAVAETQAQVVELQQASRLDLKNILQLEAQLGRETMAQDSMERAIKASQEEADRWKKAAHPGFVLGLWKDAPKLIAVGVAAFVYGRSGG